MEITQQVAAMVVNDFIGAVLDEIFGRERTTITPEEANAKFVEVIRATTDIESPNEEFIKGANWMMYIITTIHEHYSAMPEETEFDENGVATEETNTPVNLALVN
jgi:hypothetical protein